MRCNEMEPKGSGLMLRCEGCCGFVHPQCVSALRAMQVETFLSLQRWVCSAVTAAVSGTSLKVREIDRYTGSTVNRTSRSKRRNTATAPISEMSILTVMLGHCPRATMTEAVYGKRAPRKAVEIGNSEDQKVHEQRFFLQSKMRAWIVTMTVIAMLMPTRNNGAVAAAAAVI